MRGRVGVLGLVGVALGLACSGPTLDLPDRRVEATTVDFEPGDPDGAVGPLFRARMRDVGADSMPWLFRGELSEYYVRALQQGDVPNALRERAVPLRFWREGSDCWVQPTVWLEPEVSYVLALTGQGVVQAVQTQAAEGPRARQVFPPAGARPHRAAVLCDLGPGPLPSSLLLEPGGIPAQLTPGMAAQPDEGCATLQVEQGLTQAVVAPPRLGEAWIQPEPWLPSPVDAGDGPERSCVMGEPFHGACLEIEDDRLRITPRGQDLFFSLTEPQRLVLAASAGLRSLLVGRLVPGSEVTLAGTVLTSEGEQAAFHGSVALGGARRHLVLNEVLANPLGAEPDAEWLELVNDSERATSLAGVWLEDSAGSVALPDVVLSPGEVALVVSAGFQASSLDVPVPEHVRLLRVPNLGSRGLSNGGEALLLVGREGVLSRFPSLAAAHAGRSLARRSLDGADADARSFGEHGGVGASPGSPNWLDE